MTEPKGGLAVMQRRRTTGVGALDFFPTPPFATRALIEDVFKRFGLWKRSDFVVDPCCGMGHMCEVLREYYDDVFASDVHDYGRGYAVGNYPGDGGLGLDRINLPKRPAFVIANPPYNLAAQFFDRAITDATFGVAMLLRSAWLEGEERYSTIFKHHPPSIIAQFAERVPMALGRWDPEGSTATAYSWLIWCEGGAKAIDTRFVWIPGGAEKRYSRVADLDRFAALTLAPKDQASLFDTVKQSTPPVERDEDGMTQEDRDRASRCEVCEGDGCTVCQGGAHEFDTEDCPGHVAALDDPKHCGRCGIHIELRPDDEAAP